jgi:hypothetical protein
LRRLSGLDTPQTWNPFRWFGIYPKLCPELSVTFESSCQGFSILVAIFSLTYSIQRNFCILRFFFDVWSRYIQYRTDWCSLRDTIFLWRCRAPLWIAFIHMHRLISLCRIPCHWGSISSWSTSMPYWFSNSWAFCIMRPRDRHIYLSICKSVNFPFPTVLFICWNGSHSGFWGVYGDNHFPR